MKYGADTGGRPRLVAYTSLWATSVARDMGEAEQRERFGYALTRAMERRGASDRGLGKALGIDNRQIAALRQGKRLPTIYESPRLAHELGVDEELFRNPPEVPKPPPYPLDDYLLENSPDAVRSGGEEGLRRLHSRAPGAAVPHPRSRAPRARAG